MKTSSPLNTAKSQKILVFFPHNLMPPKTGAHRRCLDLLVSLRTAGHEVTLVSSQLFTDVPWTDESVTELKTKYGIRVLLHQGTPDDHVYLQSHNQTENWNYFTPLTLMHFFNMVYDALQPEIVLINYAMWSGLVADKKFDCRLCWSLRCMISQHATRKCRIMPGWS